MKRRYFSTDETIDMCLRSTFEHVSFFLLLIVFLPISCITERSEIEIDSLKCNYKDAPTGVGKSPIFSWILKSNKRNQFQSAYQVIVSENSSNLKQDNTKSWNSGKISSEQSIGIVIKDLKLDAGTKYYWKVRVWDKNDRASSWSKPAYFITALFDKEDWSGAKWISMEEMEDSLILVPGIPTWGRNTRGIATRRPVIPLFRKEFVTDKNIESAYLFVSGLGQYKAYINGATIGDDFLSPGWTHFQKTCQYNTYDITDDVRTGDNAIGIIVGNGFHNINNERYRKLLITYGMPKTIAKIQINYSDGSTESIVTGNDWKTASSPITYSSIYGGETYNAQLEVNGWKKSDFDDSEWQDALLAGNPEGTLRPETSYPVKVMESFKPERIVKTGKDSFMIDFGQNASGIFSVQVRGNKGDTIKLIPSELIHDDYSANQRATGSPHFYEYILKGDGIESWQPMFTYYGLRYVQVYGVQSSDYKVKNDVPKLLDISMLHTYNSSPHTGSFRCSNSLFNLIDTLIRYGIQSNLQSVMTDCPHREKLGWLEQTYLMGGSVQHNYEVYHLFFKIVRDMMDSQRENGLVGSIAPEYVVFGDEFTDSPEWGSAIVILPWLVYKWYGDISLIQEAWTSMINYVSYLDSKADKHILSYGLGDWYDLGPERPGFSQLSPIATTATAIYYYDYILLTEMARKLNKKSEGKALQEKAELIRKAYNKLLFDSATGIYASGSQTSMAIPLSMGIVEDKYRDLVLQNLVDSIIANDKAITAGDIGFHYLLDALTKGNQSQLIFEMNNRDDVPGYGYQILQGATALTESWQALPSVSNNHMMLGHIEEWFYKGLGGIRQEENSVAYKNIIINPTLIDGIDEVKTYYETPYGRIRSEWKKDTKNMFFNIEIPVNTAATIYLPVNDPKFIYEKNIPIIDHTVLDTILSNENKFIVKLGSGSYQFKVEKYEE